VADFPKEFPRRGEIYRAKLPEDREGSAQRGRRPVLIVSNDINNNNSTVVVTAAITSKEPPKPYPFVVQLPAGRPLQEAGTVLCNQLYTFDRVELETWKGELDPDQLEALDRALACALGLPKPRLG
jgi:mRNA interferase MazF